jgi:SOS-response transcriptional repressors (RecA-mediated autopeptidases)
VKYQVGQLEEKGHLARRDRMPRTIVAKPRRLRSIPPEFDGTPADPGLGDMISMPLFESVAAGTGVDANPDAVDTIRLPRDMVGHGNVFAVRVAGDSMVDASIFDGDCLVVRQQDDAVNGDIVIALLGEEGVVKTFRRTENHIWLMPENSSYDPILGDGCQIRARWWPPFTVTGAVRPGSPTGARQSAIGAPPGRGPRSAGRPRTCPPAA